MARSLEKPNPKLIELSQRNETWHLATRQSELWLAEPGQKAAHPFITILAEPEQQLILAMDVSYAPLTIDQVYGMLEQAMLEPHKELHEKAHRPSIIQFEDQTLFEDLARNLKQIDVEAVYYPHLETIDEILAEFEQNMHSEEEIEIPGLLDSEGVTPELLRRVFTAARDYYAAEPWKYLADTQPVAIQIGDQPEFFIQLMGQAQMQYGFLVHKKWVDLLQSYNEQMDPIERIPTNGWETLTFEASNMVPPSDLELIEKYKLPVINPTAYPVALIYHRESLERPGLEKLLTYEIILRALPRFLPQLIASETEEDEYLALESTLQIDSLNGKQTVRLRYPAGDLPEFVFSEDSLENFDWSEDEDFEDEFDDDDEDYEGEEIDPRAFEASLSSLSELLDISRGMEKIGDPALHEAQALMYKAWGSQNPEKRVEMAYQALELSPDCADAYVLLAEEEAESGEEAFELFQKGMAAGERVLGDAFFEENTGKFWGIIETRGYMRAKQGLAEVLEYLNRSEEAVTHYQNLLQLNPNDNQGIRYDLLRVYLQLQRNQEAGELLETYRKDDSAAWCYGRALLAFRRLGGSIQADAALRRAVRENPHVPPYLTGEKPLPEDFPDYTESGGEDEAANYALENYENWWQTRGAVAWLKETWKIGQLTKSKQKRKTTRGRKRS